MWIVKYLKERGIETVQKAEEALEPLGISVGDYGAYAVFNYSQIDSPKFDPVVVESRGLILDVGSWNVRSRAFDRFFNYNEDPNTANFPIEKAIVTEKVDGSLISIWFDEMGSPIASTRKMLFAEGETPSGIPFIGLIERALGQSIFKFPGADYFQDLIGTSRVTLICELVAPESRVVRPYQETALYLLAIRNVDTGLEYSPEVVDHVANRLGLLRPEQFKFETFEDVQKALSELPAMEEGYVAAVEMAEGKYWRLKIKNPAYLAIAHLRDNGAISRKRVASLVWTHNDEEYLSYFPEDATVFKPFQKAMTAFLEEVRSLWEHSKFLEDQKDFALRVKDSRCASILFRMRKGMGLDHVLTIMDAKQQFNMLEKYIEN